MSESTETFEEWRDRTALPAPRAWSRRKRLTSGALVLVLGVIITVPRSDHPVGMSLLVLLLAFVVGISDDDLPRTFQLLVMVVLGGLALVFSQPDGDDWLHWGSFAALASGIEGLTRWRARRH